MASIQKLTGGLHSAGLLNTLPRKVVAALSAIALLAISARVQVPFWPVPMTLQTLTVLLVGYLLGFRLAMATMAAYLISGAAGLPMFAGTPERGLGLAYMVGPTGGYLVGFVFAAAIASQIRALRSKVGVLAIPAGLFFASAAIHVFGFVWLSQYLGVETAWKAGVLPFVLGDLVKLGLASLICYRFSRLQRSH